MRLDDGSNATTIRHYEGQRSVNSLSLKNVQLRKRLGCVSSKIWFAQGVHFPQIGLIITVQPEQKRLILITSKSSTGKCINFRVARVNQDIKRNLPFQIIVLNVINEKIVLKNQVAMAGDVP